MTTLLRCFSFCGLLTLFALWGQAQGSLSESVLIYSTDKEVAVADSNVLFTVKEISINGNKRTKDATILRELSFELEQSYELATIIERFNETKQQLMNTSLFRNVAVSLRSIRDHDVYINIEVEEKWYFYPLPFVRVVDDKFSRWWNEKGRSLDQLNYGIRFTQNNFSGRNDKLFVYLVNGYTKQVEVEYKGLYLDPALKWYVNFNAGYGMNHEINYATEFNKQVGIKVKGDYAHKFSHVGADLVYRPGIKLRHSFHVGYSYDHYADTVYKLNPFFAGTNGSMYYPEFAYTITYSDLDFNPYPTKGMAGELSIGKKGFNSAVNLWQLTAKGTSTWPAIGNSFFNVKAIGTVKLPFKQPYMMQQFLGSGDQFMQGYENYVVDGVAGGYTKASIVKPIFKTMFHLPNNRFSVLNNIPFKVYAKAFVNTGYIYNPNHTSYDRLNNKMLYSGGFGLDIVAFTDMIIKFEWSFNQLGQNGLYLHQREMY